MNAAKYRALLQKQPKKRQTGPRPPKTSTTRIITINGLQYQETFDENGKWSEVKMVGFGKWR
jgi:hypothetical protein